MMYFIVYVLLCLLYSIRYVYNRLLLVLHSHYNLSVCIKEYVCSFQCVCMHNVPIITEHETYAN